MDYNRAEQALAFDPGPSVGRTGSGLRDTGRRPGIPAPGGADGAERIRRHHGRGISVHAPGGRRLGDGTSLPNRPPLRAVQAGWGGSADPRFSRSATATAVRITMWSCRYPKKTGSTGDRGDALSEGQCGEKLEEVSGDDFYQIKDVPHGSVRREYFYSSVTGEWESCTVYTPAAYEEETDKTFPVLYLQHGHGENETGWTTAGKLQFILDNLIAEGKAVPFAVVMCNGMVQTVTEDGRRIVDFMLLEPQLLTDVIPFVEKKFRIGGSRERRAMAGLSMGSLQTSIIGFTHPEYFCALGVFSGFVTDMMQGTELDMVDRGPGNNEHLRILDDVQSFARTFPVFFVPSATKTHTKTSSTPTTRCWKPAASPTSAASTTASTTGTCGGSVSGTSRR